MERVRRFSAGSSPELSNPRESLAFRPLGVDELPPLTSLFSESFESNSSPLIQQRIYIKSSKMCEIREMV